MNNDIDTLRSVYGRLEPTGTDAWNPLQRGSFELWHRARLLLEATAALRLLPGDSAQLRVLDVGSGVGRSTRLLVELGFRPENLLAIDFRADALELARSLNPSIRYQALRSLDDWPNETFDLCVQCTAFSSLPGPETREMAARHMSHSVGSTGHIYWWDGIRANEFAGGDELQPARMFKNRTVRHSQRVSLYPTFAEAALSLPRGSGPASRLLQWLPSRRTHESILFGPTH